MIKAVLNTKNYFQAPANYFWQWADNGEYIEWKNGTTICHRDELILILKEMPGSGAAPLGTILLLMAACMNTYRENETLGILLGLLRVIKSKSDNTENDLPDHHIQEAIKFMNIVSQLPDKLRKRQQIMHLMNEVFGGQNFVISSSNLKEAADELNSGRLDKLIIEEGEEITREQFKSDLLFLRNALLKFPTVGALELRLRTGLDKIPDPIEINVPVPTNADLLDMLQEDPRTAGIARLTKRLVAALNIPMHSQGSGDQSYGGISDITNRGNYDKLLLSELAHDEILLMARLVNNEALYFRREEPPDNPKRQRTILLDSTLKMWGIPRVFALSAALACARNSKHGELIEAYSLGGVNYREITLDTTEGIIQSLEMLDHSLHCGKALEAVLNELPSSEQNEYIFITDEKLLQEADFQSSFSNARESLSFMLTVKRNGDMHFYECIKGRTKLLSTAKFDLDELLFVNDNKKKKQLFSNDALPEFVQLDIAPLYFPLVRVSWTPNKYLYNGDLGSVVINETKRVLFIKDRKHGVKELASPVEEGEYIFGFGSNSDLFLMVISKSQNLLWFYSFNSETGKTKTVLRIDQFSYINKVIFDGNNSFYIKTPGSLYMFNCSSESIKQEKPGKFIQGLQIEDNAKQAAHTVAVRFTPDSILTKFKTIFISSTGEICFGNHCINLPGKNIIKLSGYNAKEQDVSTATEYKEDYRPLLNKRIRFRKFIWDDGSEAVVDTRGLLHLRSSDGSIPEITIPLVINQATACWASDGTVSGSAYFYDAAKTKVVSVEMFYAKYIKPFIERIVKP